MKVRIRLLQDLPIESKWGCTAGNEYDAEIPDGLQRGKMASFYIDGQLIKAHKREYEIVSEEEEDAPNDNQNQR